MSTPAWNFFAAGNDQRRLREALDRATVLQQRLWSEATALAKAEPTILSSLLIQSINDTLDFDAQRRDALHNRIPPPVWILLTAVSLMACFLTGYVDRRRASIVILALPLVLAAVLTQVADLDSPRSGMIVVSQQQMLRLKSSLAGTPPPASAAAAQFGRLRVNTEVSASP